MELSHSKGISVEAEVGSIGGEEDGVDNVDTFDFIEEMSVRDDKGVC